MNMQGDFSHVPACGAISPAPCVIPWDFGKTCGMSGGKGRVAAHYGLVLYAENKLLLFLVCSFFAM